MGYLKVDRKDGAIMEAIVKAPVFNKQGKVNARLAIKGEKVTTSLANGNKETDNTAKAGDYVVTNPSGEQYIIAGQTFIKRYESTDEAGVYQAKGSCRAIRNPFGQPIEIMASWGEPQTGDENCMIADTCDKNGENMGGEPYLIDSNAFVETYK